MEEKKEIKVKPKRSTKSKVITVMLCIALFCVFSILLIVIFDKNEPINNQQENKQKENKEENNKEEQDDEIEEEDANYKPLKAGVYKTKDNVFTLTIVDISDTEIKEKAKKRLVNYNSKLQYAYINDRILQIFETKEDDKYLTVFGWLEGNEGSQFSYIFLISKDDNLINEYRKPMKPKDYNRFTGENNSINFVKTDAGYFFTRGLSYGPYADILYTTSWKELGYVDYDKIEADSKGVYVYTKVINNTELDKTSKTKFDVNGNKID